MKKYIGDNTKRYLSELIDDLKTEHTPEEKPVPERPKLDIRLFSHKLTESSAYEGKKNMPKPTGGQDNANSGEDEKKQ